MRLPEFVVRRLAAWADRVIESRPPDVNIGGIADPYMRRWHAIKRNRFFNIYVHEFLRSDDDRALHDHPWVSCSILARGSYFEWMPHNKLGQGYYKRRLRLAGEIVLRRATAKHRVELLNDRPCRTIFFTGPKVREWGFWCKQGFVHWRDFTAGPNGETVGKGCGQ